MFRLSNIAGVIALLKERLCRVHGEDLLQLEAIFHNLQEIFFFSQSREDFRNFSTQDVNSPIHLAVIDDQLELRQVVY